MPIRCASAGIIGEAFREMVKKRTYAALDSRASTRIAQYRLGRIVSSRPSTSSVSMKRTSRDSAPPPPPVAGVIGGSTGAGVLASMVVLTFAALLVDAGSCCAPLMLAESPRGGAERYLTLSAGVANLVPPRELALEALINACTTALERSKKQGKNGIATAEAADFP